VAEGEVLVDLPQLEPLGKIAGIGGIAIGAVVLIVRGILDKTSRLEQAVAAYRDALMERTRERVPRDWAQTQHNLGLALATLGGREGGTSRLEQAVAAYHDALMERTRERVPLDWAVSVGNQGLVLMQLAQRASETAMAETAVVQIAAAIETLRAGGRPPLVSFYEKRLSEARSIRDALKFKSRRASNSSQRRSTNVFSLSSSRSINVFSLFDESFDSIEHHSLESFDSIEHDNLALY
jgi:hypothetical protein